MSSTLPPITARAAREVSTLKKAIPKLTANNLLMATWNLREFSGLCLKWESGPKDQLPRDQATVN